VDNRQLRTAVIIILKLIADKEELAPRDNPRCIHIQLVPDNFSLNAEGWSLITEGIAVTPGPFNRGGFAALCLDPPGREFKFTIRPRSGVRVIGMKMPENVAVRLMLHISSPLQRVLLHSAAAVVPRGCKQRICSMCLTTTKMPENLFVER
jgi:hypothetical protein